MVATTTKDQTNTSERTEWENVNFVLGFVFVCLFGLCVLFEKINKKQNKMFCMHMLLSRHLLTRIVNSFHGIFVNVDDVYDVCIHECFSTSAVDACFVDFQREIEISCRIQHHFRIALRIFCFVLFCFDSSLSNMAALLQPAQ